MTEKYTNNNNTERRIVFSRITPAEDKKAAFRGDVFRCIVPKKSRPGVREYFNKFGEKALKVIGYNSYEK